MELRRRILKMKKNLKKGGGPKRRKILRAKFPPLLLRPEFGAREIIINGVQKQGPITARIHNIIKEN